MIYDFVENLLITLESIENKIDEKDFNLTVLQLGV
jgi:hypothetical protein